MVLVDVDALSDVEPDIQEVSKTWCGSALPGCEKQRHGPHVAGRKASTNIVLNLKCPCSMLKRSPRNCFARLVADPDLRHACGKLRAWFQALDKRDADDHVRTL